MNSELASNLRRIRKQRQLSQPALAGEAGVSKGYIFSLESGDQTNPSLEVLMKIADALKVTIADLVGGPITTRASVAEEDVPDSLRKFASKKKRVGEPLSDEDMSMLMAIKHRDKRPESVADWEFLFEAIRRSVEG